MQALAHIFECMSSYIGPGRQKIWAEFMFLRNIRLQPFTREFWIAKSCWGFVMWASYWLAMRCLQAEHRCGINMSRYKVLPCFVYSRMIWFGRREDGLAGCELNGQPRLPLVWYTQLYWAIWKFFSCLFSNEGRIAIYYFTPDTSAGGISSLVFCSLLVGWFNSVPWRCETSPGQQEAHV